MGFALWKLSVGELSRWEFSEIGIFRGDRCASGCCPGGNYTGWELSGCKLSGAEIDLGGSYPSGSCPGGNYLR